MIYKYYVQLKSWLTRYIVAITNQTLRHKSCSLPTLLILLHST